VRVLVTGASGFLGSWVARELAARGHAVRALVRPSSPLDNLAGLEHERVEGDVLDPASVRRALRRCDAVAHVAGLVTFHPGDRERLLAANVRGVEVVLGEALAAGIGRAVVTSSTAAMGGRRSPEVLHEGSPSNAEALGIHYMVSKRLGEEAARAIGGRGLPLVVLRPAFLLGPGDLHRSSAGLALAVARRAYRFFVQGGASFCDVRDVARAHVEALERGRPGECYVLGGHNLTLDRFMAQAAAAAGVPPPRRVPYALAWAAAAGAEWVARRTGRRPKLTRQLLRSSSLYTYASSERASADLGYAVRPLQESLEDTLAWFIARGLLSSTTPQLGALAGRVRMGDGEKPH